MILEGLRLEKMLMTVNYSTPTCGFTTHFLGLSRPDQRDLLKSVPEDSRCDIANHH
jgi:hypothetical protein